VSIDRKIEVTFRAIKHFERSKMAKTASTSLKLDRLTAKDLPAASQTLFTAVQRGDITKVAGALSPDFNFIDERGLMFMRSNCVAAIQSMVGKATTAEMSKVDIGPIDTKLKLNSFKVSETQTRRVGNTVIQTMLYTDSVALTRRAGAKTAFNRSFRWTNVWVEENGNYLLAFTQLTPVQ
jgi:hypothetical protein